MHCRTLPLAKSSAFSAALACLLAACGDGASEAGEREQLADPAATASAVATAEESPDDGFAPAREAIEAYCKGDAACVAEQRSELGYFVTMMAAFEDEGHAAAERCMRSGKVEGGVDWTVATPCLRETVKGKPIEGAAD